MRKPLNIVQLVPDLNSGGVEKGTLEVARAIVDAGHHSLVISSGGLLVKTLLAEGSEHITWNLGKKSPLTFLQAGTLRRWFQDNNIDIVHARSRLPAWVAYLAWKKMPRQQRPRFVTTMHGLNSVSRYSKIMTYGEKVIAVSDTVKNYILEHYPDTAANKIITIHRGIDPEEFPFGYQPDEAWQASWYQSFPQTRNTWLLTLPGRLTRLKGHHDFIDVIKQLKQSVSSVHGLIVGGEDPKRRGYAQELYQRVKDEGLENSITFSGYRSDMKQIYAISAAVLSLSTKPESFGRTAVEALSLGRAVIAYDHGGVGETLAQIYPDGLVRLKDIAGIVAKSGQLYHHDVLPPQQPQMVYLKDAMLDQTLALYESLA